MLEPNNPTECRDMFRDALANTRSLQVVGGQTRVVPGPVSRLSTANLDAVRFFHPQDMVIGVEAGVKLANLWPILEKEGMSLPVNAWYEGATLGGMVAANDYGADRMFGGGLRDYLIGMEYVDGRCELVKAGGKVVKNVTGYDAARMMVGSLGGLGCITALNFRLVPAKTNPMVGFLEGDSPEPLVHLQRLVQSRTPFDWMEVRGIQGKWQFAFGYSGNPARRTALEARLKNSLGTAWQFQSEADLPEAWRWTTGPGRSVGFLNSLPAGLGPNPWHVHLNAPTSVWRRRELVEALAGEGSYCILHPAGGDGHWFLPQNRDFQAAFEHWEALWFDNLPSASHLELVHVPEIILEGRHRYQPVPQDYTFSCRFKRHLDPNDLFHAPFYSLGLAGLEQAPGQQGKV